MTETKKPETVRFLRKLTPYDTDGQAGKILLAFGNGKTIEIEIERISEPNRTHAIYHGLSQRFGDAIAGCSKDSAYDYAEGIIHDLYAQLQTADWSKPAQGGKAKAEAPISDLVEAIAKIKKLDPDAIRATIEAASRETRDTWRQNARIAAELAAIVARRLKEAAKTDEAEDFDFPMV